MRALLALGTAHFVPRVRPALTPRRIAVLAAWEDGDDTDARWAGLLGNLCTGAREHWHVEAELVRAAFSDEWKGWTPDVTDACPLDAAEPALILISGELRARYVPAFACARSSNAAVSPALPRSRRCYRRRQWRRSRAPQPLPAKSGSGLGCWGW